MYRRDNKFRPDLTTISGAICSTASRCLPALTNSYVIVGAGVLLSFRCLNAKEKVVVLVGVLLTDGPSLPPSIRLKLDGREVRGQHFLPRFTTDVNNTF